MRPSPPVRRARLVAAIHGILPDRSGRSPFALLGAATIVFAGNVLPVAATTYVVDTANDTTTPGKTTLREAVFQANGSADNIVQFDASLNGSTITLSQGEISITQPMYIIGPGADKLTISGNDVSRIFNISAPSSTPIAVNLSGLALVHGKCSGYCLGGAIYAKTVSLTVQNAVLAYNTGTNAGAIFCNGGNSTAASELTGTTIAKNNASFAAGFEFTGGQGLHIADSIIDGNTASQGYGGGELIGMASAIIERSRVTGNKAQFSKGGGLSVINTTLLINNSTISGNMASGDGGGLALINVVATLTGNTISGNSAKNGGGILVDDGHVPPQTDLTLQQSSVSGNSATTFGGGIDLRRVLYFTISRSLISGNNVYDSAGGGGGIALEYAKNQSLIINSTIYGNYAYNNGGGVGMFNSAGITVFNGATIAGNVTFNYTSNGILGAGYTLLYNSVLANGTSHSSNQDLAGSFSEYYSLIRNVGNATIVGHSNKNGQEPLLGPLAVNGGPTLTMLPALTSPVLDAGSGSLSGTDQRGLPRTANGRTDMGAVERQYPEDIIFRNGFDTS